MATVQTSPESYLAPADISRILGNHPSAPVRWMRRGTVLSDGTRLFLRFVRLPGGYRVKPEWLDEFLAALTADRHRGTDAPGDLAKPTPKAAHVASMRAGLAANGF
jgi:hypothetical protein